MMALKRARIELMRTHFYKKGWAMFKNDPILADWIAKSSRFALNLSRDPTQSKWLRCNDTWFAGVNLLNNDVHGSVSGGPPLAGAVIDFINQDLGIYDFAWDRAQISICYPGYPKKSKEESEKAFIYRKTRDGAHIDGVLKQEPARRRFMLEYHAFILGIPITTYDHGASPLVVWEGSHELIRKAFQERLYNVPEKLWANEDLTEAYHAVRRKIFETCKRVEIYSKPGASYIIHRLSLHGIAPWAEAAKADPNFGRAIIYFRPTIFTSSEWLLLP